MRELLFDHLRTREGRYQSHQRARRFLFTRDPASANIRACRKAAATPPEWRTGRPFVDADFDGAVGVSRFRPRASEDDRKRRETV